MDGAVSLAMVGAGKGARCVEVCEAQGLWAGLSQQRTGPTALTVAFHTHHLAT